MLITRLFEDALNIFGNLMYSLYYSPDLILFGELLIGATSARITSSVGEISRVYETEKLTQKLVILGIVTFAGCIIKPCTTFFPQYIDIDIGKWKWNVGNMAGISMIIFHLLQFGINYFTLDNVSKEYTLKKDFPVVAAIENSDRIEKNCMTYANDKSPLKLSAVTDFRLIRSVLHH